MAYVESNGHVTNDKNNNQWRIQEFIGASILPIFSSLPSFPSLPFSPSFLSPRSMTP